MFVQFVTGLGSENLTTGTQGSAESPGCEVQHSHGKEHLVFGNIHWVLLRAWSCNMSFPEIFLFNHQQYTDVESIMPTLLMRKVRLKEVK